MSLDRHNHFVRGRRDFQLAFDLCDLVVARLRTFFQLVGERVRSFANVGQRARHFIRRAFVLNKALAACGHFVLRQRGAVVDLLARARGQRHIALLDHELAVDCLRNDILSCSVNRALSSGREDSVILSSILSRRANCDRAEISVFRRTGKAGNALLLSIISLRVAVRRQRHVLIIVEIDLVRSLGDRDRLLFIRFRRNCVAFNRGGGCLHGTAKRRFFCLLSNRCVLIAHPIVVYRVVSNHRPHVFIIELYIFYRFVKIYLGVQIRIAFPFCF